MTSIRLRPRFEHLTKGDPKEVTEKFRKYLNSECPCCSGTAIEGHIILSISKHEEHFWSPQLNLSLEEHENEGTTLIRGLYGPKPSIWALFFYGYAALVILALIAGMLGLAQKTLGHPAPILWSLPVMGGIALALYFTAQFGQKLGVEQTFTLHHAFEEAIGEKVHIH